jgi:Baseplate J-like protein
VTFLDIISPASESTIRSRILGFAQGAGLKITSWITGDIGQQVFEMSVSSASSFVQIVSQVVRGFASLDTSTDPGDEDSYDPSNVDAEPGLGFLSAYGENVFGTTRSPETFASGSVLFVNAGTSARDIAPEGVTFTWTEGSPPSPPPTYHNSADTTVYTNPDGTVTIAAGTSLELPVECDTIGAQGTCPSGSLSLTTTLLGCTATNSEAIVGNDRESAAVYRARCRLSSARISLGGPNAAYEYLASKNLDGTPLMNGATPPAPVGITRVYVSQDSSTGIVNTYYASNTGPAIAEDVTAANANIELECFAVPDAITFTGMAAVAVPVHVTGSARIKAAPGITEAVVKAAIVSELTSMWPTIPIGGFDQTAGAGVLYTTDISAWAKGAYPGLYDVVAVVPGGATTALALGKVATLQCASSDWTVTIV